MQSGVMAKEVRKANYGGFRARFSAVQDTPGDRFQCSSFLKGGGIMVKNMFRIPDYTTALVALGWFSFILGQLVMCPLISIPLMAIARVLP